jgi:hypothetical protein
MTEHERQPAGDDPVAPEDRPDVEDALTDAAADTTKAPDADEESEATEGGGAPRR